MPDTLSEALDRASSNRDRSIEALASLVRVPSLTGEEGDAQTHVAGLLDDLGAETVSLEPDVAALFERFPMVAMGDAYWKKLMDFARTTMFEGGTIGQDEVDVYHTDDPDEAVRQIIEVVGRPKR